MGEKSWKQIKDELRGELWPFPTEAKTQIAVHTKYFLEGIMEIQKYVPCLQKKNTTVFPFCATYFQCGLTVVDAPNLALGAIQRVYTVVGDEWCDRVSYKPTNYDHLVCWSKAFAANYTAPENVGMDSLPMGFKFAEATSDSDCASGRARTGLWAIHRGRLYIAPWIQSNETLVVEWDGMKHDWQDEDRLDDGLWHARALAVLRDFVWWKHCKRFGDDPQEKRDAKQDYSNGLAELMHDCREATQQQQAKDCPECTPQVLTTEQLDDDDEQEDTEMVIGVIGDYGDYDSDSEAATDLVKSWTPDFIVTLGDNQYGSDVTPSDCELRAMSPFRDYIYPYLSFQTPKLTSAATRNNFYPTIGNHDRDPDGRLAMQLALMNVPKVFRSGEMQPSTGYYEFVRGFVHFFIYDSGYDNSQVSQQADGVDLGSVQATWLQAALARSTARWKIVCCHHPGYTSFETGSSNPVFTGDGYLSYTAIRNIINKLKLWGADLFLNGHVHAYERMDVMGFPVINNGLGGRNIDTFGTPIPFSEARFRDAFGAQKLTVTCDTLTSEFIDVDGNVQDTLELEK